MTDTKNLDLKSSLAYMDLVESLGKAVNNSPYQQLIKAVNNSPFVRIQKQMENINAPLLAIQKSLEPLKQAGIIQPAPPVKTSTPSRQPIIIEHEPNQSESSHNALPYDDLELEHLRVENAELKHENIVLKAKLSNSMATIKIFATNPPQQNAINVLGFNEVNRALLDKDIEIKELKTQIDTLQNQIKEMENAPPTPAKNGIQDLQNLNYSTLLIRILSDVVNEFWINYTPNQKPPKQDYIIRWIMDNHQVSQANAKAIDQIARHETAKTGVLKTN